MATFIAGMRNIYVIFLQVPSATEQWKMIAEQLYTRWNLPNCIGAIDGKHIQVKAPNQGSEYYNYLGYQSIILLALVDASYCITYFDVGTNGRAGDASVFRESTLHRGLESDELGVHGPRPLPFRVTLSQSSLWVMMHFL